METLYNYTCILLGICSIVNGLELLSLREFRLQIITQSRDLKFGNYIKVNIFLILQVLFSFFLIISILSESIILTKLFLWAVFLLIGCTYIIKTIGRDGSDQLRLICFGILALCSLLDKELSHHYSLVFISLQVIISYFTSGMCKLMSSYWRKGDALANILNNYTYGSESVATVLKRYKNVNKILTYSPIFLMISFPFSFLIPEIDVLLISLTLMFSFHFGTSVLMGLNDFILTFPATYPCLIGFHILIYG